LNQMGVKKDIIKNLLWKRFYIKQHDFS
jgi:hypothetical protein